jgi:cell division protease FtsH
MKAVYPWVCLPLYCSAFLTGISRFSPKRPSVSCTQIEYLQNPKDVVIRKPFRTEVYSSKKYPLSQKYYDAHVRRLQAEPNRQRNLQRPTDSANSDELRSKSAIFGRDDVSYENPRIPSASRPEYFTNSLKSYGFASRSPRNYTRPEKVFSLEDLIRKHNESDDDDEDEDEDDDEDEDEQIDFENFRNNSNAFPPRSGLQIIINTGDFGFGEIENSDNKSDGAESGPDTPAFRRFHKYQQQFSQQRESRPKKSEHFEVVLNHAIQFRDIGGYESVKRELEQCVDILKNHTKYSRYNVRVPKGLIFEGPPGTGKTLLAKALAGEAGTAFIAVSGAEFQEKYVGVGPSRVRELFALAKNNQPCIVFIDEIDALGRKRSMDGESSTERDNTLNELLVGLDGFKNTSGVFLVGATNRIDLLDPALIRPGRIDKRIHIGYPDATTRKAILAIHSKGKPCDISVNIEDLVEITAGMSGAQIENLLNEALLNALRENRECFTHGDIEIIMNKLMAGWQPIDHQFNDGIIHQIAIHEMGHSIVGLLSKHHSKMQRVIINLSSPTSPAYTVFEASTTSISTREALFEHLMILLSGRIAEEIFFEASVSTGAINDFEEALKLAERMIVYYGMGKQAIYPSRSEKYKEIIDVEIADLLNSAHEYAEYILKQSKPLIIEGAEMLKRDKLIKADTLMGLMATKYPEVLALRIQH